ncbi:MAG: hypothetical protein IPJ69_08165 [Deltaproteobacteria bacterium]|nr:MAG: hypothetical protein IPJ69_08165 [Deltaproteobacteria bacterium]
MIYFRSTPDCLKVVPPSTVEGINVPVVATAIFSTAQKINEYVAAAVGFLAKNLSLGVESKVLLWRALAKEIECRAPGFVSDFFWDKDGNYVFAGALNEGAILVINPKNGDIFTGKIPGGFLGLGIDTAMANLRPIS